MGSFTQPTQHIFHSDISTHMFMGQTGHCSALPQLESDGLSQGTMCHLQWPIKEKSDPPGCPGLERVVQSISPHVIP